MFCSFIGIYFSVHAQGSSNIVMSAENGEVISLTVDGELINRNPMGQVRVDGLAPGMHKIVVSVQKGTAVNFLRSSVYLEPDFETYYNVKRNNSNQYVIRMYNNVALAPAPNMNNGQPNVISSNPQNPNMGNPQNPNIGNPNVGNLNNNVININVGGNINTNPQGGGGGGIINPNPPNPLPGYNGPIGCPRPVSDADFQNIKNVIAKNNFESTKLTVAKQILSSNCLLSKDVREIMKLFTFESSRLELAKFAYGYTYDLANYYVVNEAFDFESSISDLDNFIRNR